MKKYTTAIMLLCSTFTFAESLPEYNATLLHDSKYILEGRDSLSDGGINSVELSAGWDSVSVGLWYGDGSDTSYNELKVFIEYGFNIGNVEAYTAFTHLEFLDDDEHADEISLGIASPISETISFAIDHVYSLDAEGGFLDLTLALELPPFIEQLSLQPYVTQSFDFGFASDDFDGENNIQLGIEGSWALNDSFSIVGLIAQSWAQKDVKRDGGGDQSWISIGLSTDF